MGSFYTAEIQDAVLTVTLTKPKQHNVLNPEEMAELTEFLNGAALNSDLRVMVLTGEGKSFCAGANLGGLGEYNFSDNPLENLSNAIEDFPTPVICRLNGGVYGGGTDLALACDFRVGSPTLKCFIPPAKIGIHYHHTGMERAVSRLGLGPSKRLFLALETMEGEELKAIGFIDYLVEVDDLDERVASLIETLKGLAPLSLSGMKSTFNHIARGTLDPGTAREAQIRCLQSEDFVEGRAALAEKRSPDFKGR